MGLKQQIGYQLLKGVDKAFGLGALARLWDSGRDLITETEGKASDPYKQVALVYTCVNELIKGIQSLPLVLSTIDEDIVESGPVYELLFNRRQNWSQFVEQAIGQYALTRDVFFLFVDELGQPASCFGCGDVADIIVAPGSQMYPVTDTGTSRGELIGWELWGLTGKRITFTVDECHQWKNFNPYSRFHGLGPIEAARNDINYDFAASLYNASALANGTEPGPIFTLPGNPDPDQVRAFLSNVEARHRGPGKTKRAVAITGGADVKTIEQSLADMQVAEITELSDKKICSAFGVPPGVAGLITEAQYSHGPAMSQFIFNTIIPLANIFAEHLTSGIIAHFSNSKLFGRSFPVTKLSDTRLYGGSRTRSLRTNRYYRDNRLKALSTRNKVFAWFDAGQHPTVQEHDREIAEKTLKFTEAGVPLNSIIESHDLPYEQTEAGNYWWVGMGQVPAKYILEAGLEGVTGPSIPEGEEEDEEEPTKAANILEQPKNIKADEQQRLRIWRNWVISWAGIEREYTAAMRMHFVKQQKYLIARLKEVFNESKSVTKASPDEIIARVVFDLKKENGKLKVLNQTFFEKGSELGIRQSLTEIAGLKGDELNKLTAQVKRTPAIRGKMVISTEKITKINATTQKLVAGQLKQGLEAGESLTELTNRLKDNFGFSLKRSQRIARTQTAGAVNSGRHYGMKATGVDKKGWLSSRDDGVRDTHRAAEAKYAEGISIDLPFEIGSDRLMYPGDPAGSAKEIAHCRCVQIAKAANGKIIELSHYQKFYSYSDMQRDKNAA